MTDSHPRPAPRGGLARAIDALFAPASGAREEVVWEEADPPPRTSSPEPDPAAFAEALESFLAREPLEREGLAVEVRAQATALREAGRLDSLADAVERLATDPADPPDPAASAMAWKLLTPAVASRVALRIGAAEGERRARLLGAARRLGREMALALFDALREATDRSARRAYTTALAELGADAVPVLDEMLEDGRWFVVRDAVAVLGRMDGPAARERVAVQLAHPDPRVRREALFAVARAADGDAGALVYGMIEDPDRDVRLAAAMAAGTLGVERAVRPLLALLEAEDEEAVQAGLLDSLGRLGDPGAVPAIEKRALGSFFSRPSTRVRIAAFEALHRIGTPRARGLLEQAAEEERDPEIRTAVRRMVAPEA
jgi:HEAT repeat protein